jgi:hypothetical protein
MIRLTGDLVAAGVAPAGRGAEGMELHDLVGDLGRLAVDGAAFDRGP